MAAYLPWKMIRLVASDLDGTLLRPDWTASERTRAALRRVRDAGVTVVLVSARSPRSVRDDAAALGIDGPAICANGATVYDLGRHEIVEHRPLSAEIATRLVTGLRREVPGVAFACERGLTFVCEPAYAESSTYPKRDFGEERADALELAAAPATKLMARHPGVPLPELMKAVVRLAGPDAAVTVSGDNFVEVARAGVTKASALERLCGRLGVDRSEVLAFGDMPNDTAMLVWAGRGVAVANAHPDVLALADEVTASNEEDGVAIVLERLQLG